VVVFTIRSCKQPGLPTHCCCPAGICAVQYHCARQPADRQHPALLDQLAVAWHC
jgi:hypothetical protein